MDKQRIIEERRRALHGMFALDMTPSHHTKSNAMEIGKIYGRAEGILMGIDLTLASMNMTFKYDDDCEIVDIVEIG